MRAKSATAIGTVGVALGGLLVVQLLPGGSSPLAPTPAAAGELVRYDSCGPLLSAFRAELARTATPYGWGYGGGMVAFDGGGTSTGGPVPLAARAESGNDSGAVADAVGTGATGTNLQERGVDEPDVVKLSDELLVTVSAGALRVIGTEGSPREIGRLTMPTSAYGGGGLELLLAGDRALVVDRGFVPGPQPAGGSEGSSATSTTGAVDVAPAPVPAPDEPVSDSDSGGGSSSSSTSSTSDAVVEPRMAVDPRVIGPAYGGTSTTVLRLADLSDPASPRWLETYEVDGDYLSARLVDGTVRLVTRSTPTPTPVLQTNQAQTPEEYARQDERFLEANRKAARELPLGRLLPKAVRTGPDGQRTSSSAAVACDDVSYAPDAPGTGLLLVTTLRPADGLAPLDTQAVQADGELVYATADRLFVATSRWGTTAGSSRLGQSEDVTTQVHAFDTTDAAQLRYVGTGSVDGYVYGRWALSWHEGSLRVATTTGEPWGSGPASQSSVVVLRESGGALREVGRVDGLGKGERIQAVRYLGDLATVVTFRQTDPLYVLDLADPTAPALRGELKVPGFSTYLHPIGDDHLLGVGMEADERTGQTTGVQASVFDLSDLSRPRQVDRLQLGRGYSEALQESRAFGYDPQRRLAVMPFQDERGGAVGLGIRVAADGTLSEVGRLGAPVQQVVAPDGSTYDQGGYARRVVLDGDRVHVLTESGLLTATAADWRRTGSLRFG